MKKILSFVGCALFVAAMTVACGHKNTEAVEAEPEATVEQAACCEATAEAAPAECDAAMLAAAKEAGQAICNCTNGDATSIERCMKSVLAAGYADYQGNEAFTKAVRAEIDNCIKARATEAATQAVNEGVSAAASALSERIAGKK